MGLEAKTAAARPDGAYKLYEANCSQTGTGNPSADVFFSSFDTITWVRDSVGVYTATGFGGGLSTVGFIIVSGAISTSARFLDAGLIDGDTVQVKSRDSSGALVDVVKFSIQVKTKG